MEPRDEPRREATMKLVNILNTWIRPSSFFSISAMDAKLSRMY